jgi:hypothetical protein
LLKVASGILVERRPEIFRTIHRGAESKTRLPVTETMMKAFYALPYLTTGKKLGKVTLFGLRLRVVTDKPMGRPSSLTE